VTKEDQIRAYNMLVKVKAILIEVARLRGATPQFDSDLFAAGSAVTAAMESVEWDPGQK